jgi:hypothetical protein
VTNGGLILANTGWPVIPHIGIGSIVPVHKAGHVDDAARTRQTINSSLIAQTPFQAHAPIRPEQSGPGTLFQDV